MQLLRLRHDQLRRENLLADRIILRRRLLRKRGSCKEQNEKRLHCRFPFRSGRDTTSSRPGVCSRKSVGAFHSLIDGAGGWRGIMRIASTTSSVTAKAKRRYGRRALRPNTRNGGARCASTRRSSAKALRS